MTTLFRTATLSLLVLMALSGGSLIAAPCVAGPTTLCLNNQRFRLEVEWKDFQGGTGVGKAIPLTADTGYFWFFNSANVELVVKVLDGRGLNGHFWVFFGALSNVEYTMRVTDTVSGALKTYFNPSGQFASVGDTQAFSASGAVSSAFHLVEDDAASRLRSPFALSFLAETADTQAMSSCVATETSLCLNGGRFRVEVNWKDFQGGTGVGKAVPLTPDTGYFWFFNSANVELVVKVLDGRGLNNRFWVFYGALSNVEYEMTVTDTVTGNVNTYFNPSGRFASTGDTAAFSTGHSVAVRLDSSRAVSADIPTSGGTISTTASNGTVYTLAIPKDALLGEQRITLTPVSAIDGLPLGGGLSAAVDLAPAGLRLFELATLTIAPPVAVPIAEEITFAWRGSGEEFFLYPPELDRSKVSMKVFHFSGYGVGRGSAADQVAQQQRIPASPEDALSQRLQEVFASRRRAQSIGIGALADEDPVALLLDYYNQTLKIPLEIGRSNCASAKRTAPRAVGWMRQASLLGCCEPEIQHAMDALIDGVANCYNESFDTCVNRNDPAQVREMLANLRQLQLFGADNRVDQSKLERCVRFELHFETSMQTVPGLFSWQVRAIVPIRLPEANPFGPLTGSASYETFKVDYTGPALPPVCSNTIATRSGVFDVSKLTIDLNAYEGNSPPLEPVIMAYYTGQPGHTHTITCPQAPPISTEWNWTDLYGFHLTQSGQGIEGSMFVARGWQRVGGAIYARKTYQISVPSYQMTTTMDLKHTPQ